MKYLLTIAVLCAALVLPVYAGRYQQPEPEAAPAGSAVENESDSRSYSLGQPGNILSDHLDPVDACARLGSQHELCQMATDAAKARTEGAFGYKSFLRKLLPFPLDRL